MPKVAGREEEADVGIGEAGKKQSFITVPFSLEKLPGSR